MTDDEFLERTARRMGVSQRQVLARYVLLPCGCGGTLCEGWMSVNRQVAGDLEWHMQMKHPKPLPSITMDDYLAREQRRLKGHRYTWAPLPKEKP